MLRATTVLRALLTADLLKPTAKELNQLLDLKERERPVPKDTIKDYVQSRVMPVLRSTEMDRRASGRDMNMTMCQLVRDATFSARVLRASPTGRFVQTIAECIRHDEQRMRFLRSMTSAQASKIIENLAFIGVRDADLFRVLVPRLNFHNLHEISRVMFTLTETNLHEVNVFLVVPFYCGETWRVEFGNTKDTKSGNCNTFEAVRILRALSKSSRAVVEQRQLRNPSQGVEQLPHQSIQQLRAGILDFVFGNAETLRGAHWVNVVRATTHFPREVSAIGPVREGSPLHNALLACDSVSDAERRHPTCMAVARAALDRVFCHLEHPEQHPMTSNRSYPFDTTLLDLVKLLPLIRSTLSEPQHDALAKRREAAVMRVLLQNSHQIQFGGVVQLLRAAQNINAPLEQLRQMADVAAGIATASLASNSTEEIPFRRIVQFSSALVSMRISCPAFLRFLDEAVPMFVPRIDLESGLSFINALGTTSNDQPSDKTRQTALLVLDAIAQWHKRSHDQALPTDRVSLMEAYPLQTAKILRAVALLEVLPSRDTLETCLGASGPAKLTRAVVQTDGTLVFDLSRSLLHFLSQARERNEKEMENVLIERGLFAACLPISRKDTQMLISSMHHNGRVPFVSFAPISWRSTMELCLAYIDPELRASSPQDYVARVEHLWQPLTEVLKLAAIAAAQHTSIVRREHHRRLQRGQNPSLPSTYADSTKFSCNAVLHFLSFLLMWEHALFQGVPRVRGKAPHDTELIAAAEHLQAQYLALLQAPLQHEHLPKVAAAAETAGPSTISDVVRHVFSESGSVVEKNDTSSNGSQAELVNAGGCLLGKRHILEITTKLPFPISLVLHPGPVNELFSEFCVPVMLESGEAPENSDDASGGLAPSSLL